MSDLSPAQIDAELRRLCHLLEDRTEELAKLSLEAAESEVRYKEAAALLTVELANKGQKTTVAEREALVLRGTSEFYREFKLAEAARNAALEGCRSLRTQINAVQSVGANLRQVVGG